MKVLVGKVNDFPVGKFEIRDVEGRSIGICRIGDRIHAVLNVCPHKLAPVCTGTISGTMIPSGPAEYVFGLEGSVLRCPWHRWEFDIETGKHLFNMSRSRLRVFPVLIEGEHVFIELGRMAA